MRIRNILGVFIMLLGVSQSASAQPAIPSISEIDADFTAERYQDVIRKSAAALQNRAGLTGEDRRAVLEMKADAHLRLKQYIPASDTFATLAKDADPDSPAAAKYSATARLLKSLTPTGQYQPKSSGSASGADRSARPTAIPVIDPPDRERALVALYEDDRQALETATERLGNRLTLQTLQDAITKAQALRSLEIAAMGTDSNSKLLMDPLKGRAAELLNEPLLKLEEKVLHLYRIASKDRVFSQTVTPEGVRQDISQKVGLTAAERTEMMGIERDLNTIITTAEDFAKKLGVNLDAPESTSRRGRGTPSPTLESVHADAAEQLEIARGVLNANYVSTPVRASHGRSTSELGNGN